MSRPRFEPAQILGVVVLALGALSCRSRAEVSPAEIDAASSLAKSAASARDPEPAASNVAATQTQPVGGDLQPPAGRDWTGAYQYEECGGPSALTPGGPAACWQYIIEIARPRGEENWRAYIAMDGYMALDRLAARGEESGTELRLRFEPKSAGSADDPPATHEPGELLLTLFTKTGETWIRFESMRTDSGRREAKLERLRPPAPGAVASKTMNPDPEGFLCKADVDCVLHRCNTKRGRCAYPCESDADCAAGTRCGAPACIPVGAVGAKRTKKK